MSRKREKEESRRWKKNMKLADEVAEDMKDIEKVIAYRILLMLKATVHTKIFQHTETFFSSVS